jgi:HD-GYP domain-containing protein (c-di-GMP phosphodiesterase class II)
MPTPILDNNYFTEHLAKVNETSKVISSEDIYNDDGVLIVKKNTEIDKKTASQIAKHKLKKSISMCVAVENILDEKRLYAETLKFIKEHEEVTQVQQAFELNKKLQIGCLYAKQFPQIMQQLTVMHLNLPELFKKTITGAWFALAIADQLDLDTIKTKETYLAALVRDFGMMYIEPKLLEQSADGGQPDWRLIQSHVVIGRLVCDDIENLPKSVRIAMFEHHEKSDGAGYPKGKQSNEITNSGRIVAMSDDLQAIYLRRFQEAGHNLANLQGFLTLNMTTYSEAIYQAVVRIIRASGCEPKSNVKTNQFSGFINNLIKTNQKYLNVCTALSNLIELINSESPVKEERMLRNFIERIIKMQVSTGVPSEEYSRWMSYVIKDKIEYAYPEMEMTNMMFEELVWQFGQIKNCISAIWKQPESSDALRAKLEDMLELLNKAIED